MVFRILGSLVIFLAFLFFPWPIGLGLSLIGIVLWERYWEAPIITFVFEVVSGLPAGAGKPAFLLTIILLLFLALVSYLRPHLLYWRE